MNTYFVVKVAEEIFGFLAKRILFGETNQSLEATNGRPGYQPIPLRAYHQI